MYDDYTIRKALSDLSQSRKGKIMEQTRKMVNAKEVSEMLSISSSYAYRIIDQLNKELQQAGYLTIHGKVDILYLHKRFFPTEDKILTH